MENKYLTVTAINNYLFYKFDTDLNLRNIYLKAEISNLRFSKGILYFVLKDKDSELSALMYQSNANKLNFQPLDGMNVLINGKISVYAKRGTYALTVFNMEKIGLGEAYLDFLRLKEKLTAEGYFDEHKKLLIPKMPTKIGVITSATGDAMHDIFSTIERRFPLAEILFYPAIVQGADAPKSLIRAIKRANNDQICQVLIIARGGGTIEDLSCFNDEQLAMTIFSSKIPTISGVGHEADYTICDFIASKRAPTPTGAAELVTPDIQELYRDINTLHSNLNKAMKNILIDKFNMFNQIISQHAFKNFLENIDIKINNIEGLRQNLKHLSPYAQIMAYESKLDNFRKNINQSYIYLLKNIDRKFDEYIDKLIILNPLNLMTKGYAIVEQDGKIISTIENVSLEKNLLIKVKNGEIDARVINRRKNEI